MSRIPFSEVLKSASINIHKEYDRLFFLFYLDKHQDGGKGHYSLAEHCANGFINLSFRGTCLSLREFNDLYGFRFVKTPEVFDIDYLISFCEYTYNIVIYFCHPGYTNYLSTIFEKAAIFYINQLLLVIESIGYMQNSLEGGITNFVPKDQAAVSVAEIVDPTLSYRVIEYNHHTMKGDLVKKRETILALATRLEPQRANLKKASSALEDNLFFLFNNINLRHNNTEQGNQSYNPIVAAMSDEELEQWYDDTYQMCLLAFLELDNEERKARINELKRKMKN